jgi:hypothetical protein
MSASTCPAPRDLVSTTAEAVTPNGDPDHILVLDRELAAARAADPPPDGASIRMLRRDRLGGLIHEYAQVA